MRLHKYGFDKYTTIRMIDKTEYKVKESIVQIWEEIKGSSTGDCYAF